MSQMTQPIRPKDESEFGGAPGLIQPPPHEPKVSERMTLIKRTNPSDPLDSEQNQRSNGETGRLR